MVALLKRNGKTVIQGSSELFDKVKMNKMVLDLFNQKIKDFGYDTFTEGLSIYCAKCRKELFSVEEEYTGNKLTITVYSQEKACEC